MISDSPGVQAETGSPQELFNHVDELVRASDYPAAIALLQASGRESDDPELLQRLIDLRIQAFPAIQRPEPLLNWSPSYDNRFESTEGFPEIEPDQLNADVLKAGIMGRGGVIVRGLMDHDKAGQMRENIDRTLLARQSFAQGKAEAENSPWYSRSHTTAGDAIQFDASAGQQYTDTGSVWSVYSPITAHQLIEYYHSIGLPRILNEYFGEPAVLSVRKWVLRCIAPNNGAAAGWHQDGQFLGDASIQTVNLWVALNDCGGDADAPGMDIVAGNKRSIYETGTQGADFNWTVGQGVVDKLEKPHSVECPRFKTGDAIFFDHYNLHRTGFGLNHTKNRYAIETWFFASSTAPDKQQPLLL